MIYIIRVRLMPQVSRWPLKREVWEKIIDLFLHSLTKINRKSELSLFIHDLLTPTERVMVAKRLAIALLLFKDHDYQSIKRKLHVTPTTISKVRRQLDEGKGGLEIALKKILDQQEKQLLWKELGDLIDLQPHTPYKANWYQRKRRRKQEMDELRVAF